VNQFRRDINQLKFIKLGKVTRNELFTFELALVEFIPHAYWHRGTDRIAVDLNGNVLTNFTPKQRPVIIEFQEISVRHLLASPNRDALLVLKLIEDAPLAEELIDKNMTYVFTKSTGLSAQLQNGSTVVLGDSTNIDEKLVVWKIFKPQIDAADPKNPIQLDLRFKNQALVSNNSTTTLTVQKVLKD
jgi:cell division septal protein FtsQ